MQTNIKIVTCPRCHKNISVSGHLTLWQCSCGQWFDYTELIPFFHSGIACLENPKTHRHPDWIEKDAELSTAIQMGFIKG